MKINLLYKKAELIEKKIIASEQKTKRLLAEHERVCKEIVKEESKSA